MLTVDVLPMPDNTVRVYGFSRTGIASVDLNGNYSNFELKEQASDFTTYTTGEGWTIVTGTTDDGVNIYVKTVRDSDMTTIQYFEWDGVEWLS